MTEEYTDDIKEYTAEDVLDDYYKDDGSRCLTFVCEDDEEMVYIVRIESITLQLTEEIEKNGGGVVAEFAAQMLNRDLRQIKEDGDFRDALEGISD